MSGLREVDRPLITERDRPLLPWIVAAGLALLALGVAAAFYYAPLEAGAATPCPAEAELVPPAETEDGVVGRPVCMLTHADGAAVVFGGSVRNTGPLPITVTGLAFDGAVEELITVDSILMAEEGAGEPVTALVPFRLAPGAERAIAVEGRLQPCPASRQGVLVSLPALPVRTSFLGISRVATVPLPTELAVLLDDCG